MACIKTTCVRLALLFWMFVFSSCATQKVSYDAKPNTDFSTLKSFRWNTTSSTVAQSDDAAIKAHVEKTLSAKGIVPREQAADMSITLTIIKRASTRNNANIGLSIGIPLGPNGALGVGTNQLLNRDNNEEAVIIIDITANKTNEAIWRGTAEGIALDTFRLRNQDKLNRLLDEVMARFPPPNPS